MLNISNHTAIVVLFLFLFPFFYIDYVFSESGSNVKKIDSGINKDIEFTGKQIGLLDSDVISASIVDLNNDGLYVIYLLSSGIYVAPFKKPANPIYYKFSGFGIPVSFSVSPKSGWLAINILIPDVGLESCLLRFDGNSFRLIQDNINMWLNFLNNGTLIAQKFNVKNKFSNTSFIINSDETGIKFSDEKISMPIDAVMNVFAFMDLNHNGLNEMIFMDTSGMLKIYESHKLIWSKKIITIDNPISVLKIKTSIVDSLKSNEKSFWLAFNDNQTANKITLLKLFYDGNSYTITSAYVNINGRIAGFNLLDGKIFLIVTDMLENLQPSVIKTKIYEIEE